jgi:transcriptional regulator with XRE-family HTH domain
MLSGLRPTPDEPEAELAWQQAVFPFLWLPCRVDLAEDKKVSGNNLMMVGSGRMTGRLIAAARALAGVSRADFARAAGLSVETLSSIEANGSAWISNKGDVEAVRLGLAHFGVVVIEEAGGMGAGVRLKFTRQDVRQIDRLESEGGIVASDDAP